MKGYDIADTICALATPEGVGAIGVIRLSGSRAIPIVDEVFQGKSLSRQKANTLHFGRMVDGDNTIDEVIVSIFRAPNSYTGEDIIEISCHGSAQIRRELIDLLTKKGARMAREGEFTFRAFINGKLDLSQAEAVADLISADSKASKELAMNQLRGGFSGRLKELRSQLMDFTSLLELELDFSEEDVDFADREKLSSLVGEISGHVQNLIQSFEYGNAIKQGIPVAIIGKPNVGKSTLLNKILNEERAIVSEIAGTTRDVIEDVVNLGGIQFRFIDTAGIRSTQDVIEGLGIERARTSAAGAKIVLNLMDGADPTEEDENKIHTNGQISFRIINKIDALNDRDLKRLKTIFNKDTHYVSAKDGDGIPELLEAILEKVREGKSEDGGIVVSNQRHVDALRKCSQALNRVTDGMENGIGSELIAIDMRQALHFLGEITGEVTSDDLLGNIFSRFCIGK